MATDFLVSKALELLIEEAKEYKSFKPLSIDLVSTMKRLLPIIEQIESLQNQLDHDVDELKELRETTTKAKEVIEKCKDVWCFKKTIRTREIKEINESMNKFCGLDLQALQYRNQLKQEKTILDLGQKIDNLSLSVLPPPAATVLCSAPNLDKDIVRFEWPLMEVKKKLLDDSVVSLVVSALPGCGKTTLVTQLCHDKDIKGKFKHIFFNVVSRTPNFKVIVKNLYEHNRVQAPTFENDVQAGNGLTRLMEKLKEEEGEILLVLDDVWDKAEEFLKKFEIEIPGYKLLLTSRFDFSNLYPTYHLKTLKDEDARSLLNQWVSSPDNASPFEYEELLRKILKLCDGLPLVIQVVGGSLKAKDPYLWEGLVESWLNKKTLINNPTVQQRLQPSIDDLEPHLKECFLDMGLLLEDQKIHASVIIDIWVELYGKGISSSKEYMNYLHDLASRSLIKYVPLGRNVHEDGFYNDLLVTQHDILRELAIWLNESEEKHEIKRKRLNLEIRDNEFPDWCLDPKQTINARLLSISTDDLFSSNWVEMDCPNAEALILNLSSTNYELPNFISKMKKLKVVVIINHGAAPARLTNLSCLSSLPNLKRIRLEKVSFTLLEILRLELSRLRKLSLVMCCSFGCDIEEIDVSKALPSLQEIDINYCYDLENISWVSQVVSLKTLSITNCYKLSSLPEAIGNLSKLQVLRLCSCINLSELPKSTERLRDLKFLDISDCLGLSKLPQQMGELPKLKKISMRKCWKCELPDSVRKLENLVVKCDEETASLWERLKPKMKDLIVHMEETEHNLNMLQMF